MLATLMMLFFVLLSAVLMSAFRVMREVLVSTYFGVFAAAVFAATMASLTVFMFVA